MKNTPESLREELKKRMEKKKNEEALLLQKQVKLLMVRGRASL